MASEIGRDVGEEYIQTKIGTLPNHRFLEYTKNSPEYETLPDDSPEDHTLKFMMEVYVHNCISLAIA